MTDHNITIEYIKEVDRIEIEINVALCEGDYERALHFENELKELRRIQDAGRR